MWLFIPSCVWHCSHGPGDEKKEIAPEADFSVAFRPGSKSYAEFSKLWERARQWKDGRDENLALMEDLVGAPVWMQDGPVAKVPRPSFHNLIFHGAGFGTFQRV